MPKENVGAVVITDKRKIERALSTIRFGGMGAGCNAVGVSFIGGMNKQQADKRPILDASSVINNTEPRILAEVRIKLKRKEVPKSADFSGMI